MTHRHGGDIIAEKLALRGVSHLFTLCGGHISPILVGAKDRGIRVVDVRDEASAVFAADAMARMTGIPGVAAVTAGPGVTNTITAVKNAQMAESPVIVFGGATATVLKGRGSLQDIDQLSLMAPITKWATSVTQISALGPTVERALEIATSGVPGPVFIEVPVDLLYPEEVVRKWFMTESGADKMGGIAGQALTLYLKAHLARQFHAPHLPTEQLAGVTLPRILAQPFGADLDVQLNRTADALARAERPVLVLGSQALVNLTPEQADELAASVQNLGIPVFLGGTARGLLGRKSALQFRHNRNEALKRADVVLVAGFPFDFRLGYGRKINRKATLVAINLSPEALRKNRRPTIAVEGHPGHFVSHLSQTMRGRKGPWESWFTELRAREEARDAQIAADAAQFTQPSVGDEGAPGVSPLYFFERMEALMGDDAVLVVDGGDFVATGSYIVSPRSPLSWLDPGVFGTLGVGGGFVVGAACARPSAELWLIYGDGSSAYSLAEFDTCTRHGLAPIAVIGNDGAWAQIARDQVEILGDAIGTELVRNDYHLVAQGYGAEGMLVMRPEEVDGAIAQARELARKGRPVVINLHLSASDFRKGSLSM